MGDSPPRSHSRTPEPDHAHAAATSAFVTAAAAGIEIDSREHSLDLPSLLPLSRDHALLSGSKFDVDAFLLSRIHIPLDELRGELRSYLAELREELVQLINDDYEEFISLGTGLRGETERLRGLERPLGLLRGEVETVRDVLKYHQDAVQAKLDERAALREEKALLDLLQRLFETLARAQALENSTDEQGKVVVRLAGEYSQLVYLRGKARAEGCKIADTVSPQIDALRGRLSRDLSSLLTTALEARDEAQMKACLKTYDSIEGWAEAEEVVQRAVRAFCSKTITPTALVASPVPVAPETPIRGMRARLEETSALARLYNCVLSQVEGYAPLLSLAHTVSPRFELFSGVLWPEICSATVDNLGSTIFAAGRPDELHKHYTTTHAFLMLLEGAAPSADAVVAMRESPAYEAFERRWQLPVYFQLRWKEIVSTLEAALSAPVPANPSTTPWALPQSGAAWDAFRACWAPEIYLPELAHRFWRLGLQVVARYGTFLSTALGSYKAGSDDDSGQDDAALRFAAAAVADVDELCARIRGLKMLQQMDVDFPVGLSTKAFAARIISILQRRCAEPLKHVRSVASQFRAAPPRSSAPSHFVSQVLRPLHTFLDARPALSAYRADWSAAVVEHVLTQYASILASVRKTEDLLRRHRKSKKSGFSLFGSSSAAAPEGDEDERFRQQMRSDIDALAADAKSLGAPVGGMTQWKELVDVVERPAEA
ncbi:uncharacterized protein CcaverHIS019_0701620 [Cutaneotrichosporon cavernicola]|uniref:Conserved oligomeric Golgi complex subunit 2 n=1 Tax=Cutaneotrichosporon cavernicola TaxID=279322 RepID=A0AA48QYS8_9TREE|nr:uncharacterized protein CcaverHIS019_0701620 [Cutaneotrichosporon cavernicola]BEI94590.1 hypothetical protein CcaverHIS019_0701620 [Cutaneotrichosporon cavernicola]